MPQVLDYSSGRPGAAAIAGAGYVGAMRYIGQPGTTKNTNAAELGEFTDRGLAMGLVFEQRAGNWRGGFTQGQIDAGKARTHATQIGFPRNRPIYMAVDQDVVSGAEFALMIDYLRGAVGPLGGVHLTGVYGEHDVCLRAQQAGVARWFWQCRAWSGTPVKLFGGRHLYQNARQVTVNGFVCDLNDVLLADWGQHNVSTIEEDDMTPDECRKVVREELNDYLASSLSWLTTGRGNAVVNPTLQGSAWAWADDPGTVTLNEVFAAVKGVDVKLDAEDVDALVNAIAGLGEDVATRVVNQLRDRLAS